VRIPDDIYASIDARSFEPYGEAYFYYADSWSLGIEVSSAERQVYIDGPRSKFFAAIAGRTPTGPRRRWISSYLNTLAILPPLIGLPFSLAALQGFYQIRSEPLHTMLLLVAAFFAAMTAIAMYAQHRRRQRR
jgi:hypothetical protein